MKTPLNKTKTGLVTQDVGYIQLIVDRAFNPLPIYTTIHQGGWRIEGTYQVVPYRGDYKIVRMYDKKTDTEKLIIYRYITKGGKLIPKCWKRAGSLFYSLKKNHPWFFEMDIKTNGPVFIPPNTLPSIHLKEKN